MLGSLKGQRLSGWQWAAVGKHPAARDYIRVGTSSPMTDGFADWVAAGYRALDVANRAPLPPPCSFRFWARGPGPGLLACGLLRDSGDAVGRPFPLLIMGTGVLEGWEERWEALPAACEPAWLQAESLANRGIPELRSLEEELLRIRPPQPAWDRHEEAARAASATADGERRIPGGGPGAANAAGVIPLDEAPGGDCFGAIQAWHADLKARGKEPPKAVFVGGNPRRNWMAYFRRPLEVDDFPRIWGPPAEAA